MSKILKIIIPLWCLFSTYWYVCEMNDNGCGCIIARPEPIATEDTLKLDSLGAVSLAYLQQQDTMHFYFANRAVEFYADSSTLSYLQHLKTYLPQVPQRKLVLYGYADVKGDSVVNMLLAEQRLKTIEKCLKRLDIDLRQIVTIAKGEVGACSSKDEVCLQRQRRVDAFLTD